MCARVPRCQGAKVPRGPGCRGALSYTFEFLMPPEPRRIVCGSGGIGRRASLRSLFPQGSGGSSPLFRITFKFNDLGELSSGGSAASSAAGSALMCEWCANAARVAQAVPPAAGYPSPVQQSMKRRSGVAGRPRLSARARHQQSTSNVPTLLNLHELEQPHSQLLRKWNEPLLLPFAELLAGSSACRWRPVAVSAVLLDALPQELLDQRPASRRVVRGGRSSVSPEKRS